MDKYFDVNYPLAETDYPKKLCSYLFQRFIEPCGWQTWPLLLDVGCGPGLMMSEFEKHGVRCFGVDKRIAISSEVFRACDLEREEIGPPDFYDVVYSKSVIEHVQNTDNVVSETYRVLKPGGLFIFLTPDWGSQHKHFFDDYTHVRAFTRKGLQNCMMINGFQDVTCEYFYQLPFVWRHPCLKFIPRLVAFLTPDSLKWKDAQEQTTKERKLIRFSKEKMLLCVGRKP